MKLYSGDGEKWLSSTRMNNLEKCGKVLLIIAEKSDFDLKFAARKFYNCPLEWPNGREKLVEFFSNIPYPYCLLRAMIRSPYIIVYFSEFRGAWRLRLYAVSNTKLVQPSRLYFWYCLNLRIIYHLNLQYIYFSKLFSK